LLLSLSEGGEEAVAVSGVDMMIAEAKLWLLLKIWSLLLILLTGMISVASDLLMLLMILFLVSLVT